MEFYKLDIPKGYKGSAASMSGGCGAQGQFFDLVPDNFVGVNIREACCIHDFLYSIGGTEKNRDIADRMFRSNLKCLVLNGSSLIFKSTNLWLCEIYYIAVHRKGMQFFNYSEEYKNIELEK